MLLAYVVRVVVWSAYFCCWNIHLSSPRPPRPPAFRQTLCAGLIIHTHSSTFFIKRWSCNGHWRGSVRHRNGLRYFLSQLTWGLFDPSLALFLSFVAIVLCISMNVCVLFWEARVFSLLWVERCSMNLNNCLSFNGWFCEKVWHRFEAGRGWLLLMPEQLH